MTESLLTDARIQVLGWALIHFVWQGALIGGATALVLRVLDGRAAITRYAAACAGLTLMFVVAIATVARALALMPAGAGAPFIADAAAVSGPAVEGTGGAPRSMLEQMLPFAVAIWAACVVALSLRLCAGLAGVRRLVRHSVPLADPDVAARVSGLAQRIGITRAFRVFESAAVSVPAVVGAVRPAVLLPFSALTGLPPAQLDAVIAHELAHIRRHDYLVNALQTVVETLLFYHPAVWWCSRQVRIEREHCCDDIAIAACGDRLVYASALAQLEALRPAAAFALAASDGRLIDRIRRILSGPPATPRAATGWGAVVLLTAVVLVAGGTAIARSPQPTAPTMSAFAAPASPAVIEPTLHAVRLPYQWTRAAYYFHRKLGELSASLFGPAALPKPPEVPVAEAMVAETVPVAVILDDSRSVRSQSPGAATPLPEPPAPPANSSDRRSAEETIQFMLAQLEEAKVRLARALASEEAARLDAAADILRSFEETMQAQQAAEPPSAARQELLRRQLEEMQARLEEIRSRESEMRRNVETTQRSVEELQRKLEDMARAMVADAQRSREVEEQERTTALRSGQERLRAQLLEVERTYERLERTLPAEHPDVKILERRYDELRRAYETLLREEQRLQEQQAR